MRVREKNESMRSVGEKLVNESVDELWIIYIVIIGVWAMCACMCVWSASASYINFIYFGNKVNSAAQIKCIAIATYVMT